MYIEKLIMQVGEGWAATGTWQDARIITTLT